MYLFNLLTLQSLAGLGAELEESGVAVKPPAGICILPSCSAELIGKAFFQEHFLRAPLPPTVLESSLSVVLQPAVELKYVNMFLSLVGGDGSIINNKQSLQKESLAFAVGECPPPPPPSHWVALPFGLETGLGGLLGETGETSAHT